MPTLPTGSSHEWDHESDFEEFRIGSFCCMIRRHELFGNLMGYVGSKDASMIEAISIEAVHGGWTYESKENPHTHEEDGLHWIGFDCAHFQDILPCASGIPQAAVNEAMPPEVAKNFEEISKILGQMGLESGATYKNMDFVRGELEHACTKALQRLKGGWKAIKREIDADSPEA